MATFLNWLLSDLRLPKGVGGEPEKHYSWWRVMCLTGVDYFSTLGYQPGIAFLAAGLLSPVATFILVLVTLFGALPVYKHVARSSPNGQGSIAMLERLFPQWSGKAFVLILLGFATTDFVITMTLSAADAAAHFIQNPFTPLWMRSQMGITLLLLSLLGAIFLRGFKEAIGIAVTLVGVYLALNVVVTAVAFWQLYLHPEALLHWKNSLLAQQSNPLAMIGVSLLLFPKLALGLSGFETGVAVMPLIQGNDEPDRVRNTRKLLLTAAVIMSVFLMATSVVTSVLISPDKFKEGGPANGRALAYMGHLYLGNTFGSVYDLSTILILAFAGASAMAGLLNLIPRYLPRFGMAPEWALASRPLVLVFLTISFIVTVLFHANVDAQGGAYATGVLVLITSAATAVTITFWHSGRRWLYLLISLVFVYTTIQNIRERPDGLKISLVFISSIVLTSLISRAVRSTELRISGVNMNEDARRLLAETGNKTVRIVSRHSQIETAQTLDLADQQTRTLHNLPPEDRLYFLEIQRGDGSEFTDVLQVNAGSYGNHVLFQARSPVVANATAAFLIYLEQTTGQIPHAYFQWTEGNPVGNLFKFLFLGGGDVAPLTHEVLRRAIPDIDHRPIIHVS